jgi:ribosomal protein L12E/L44/L45/RPP1/RPP2
MPRGPDRGVVVLVDASVRTATACHAATSAALRHRWSVAVAEGPRVEELEDEEEAAEEDDGEEEEGEEVEALFLE